MREGGGSGTSVRKPGVSALIAADALRPPAQDQRLSVPEPAAFNLGTGAARCLSLTCH